MLTAENNNILLKYNFEKVIQVMGSQNITFVKLYPHIQNEFRNYSQRQLWANPDNGHPDYYVLKDLAEETYNLLNDLHYFSECQKTDSVFSVEDIK